NAAADRSVALAQCADAADGGGRRAGRARIFCGRTEAIRFFVVVGLHVLAELLPGRIVSRDGPSSVRCGLVGADPPVQRAHCQPAVSLDGHPVCADRRAGAEPVSLDEPGGTVASRPCVVGEETAVHDSDLLREFSLLLSRLVGAVAWLAQM